MEERKDMLCKERERMDFHLPAFNFSLVISSFDGLWRFTSRQTALLSPNGPNPIQNKFQKSCDKGLFTE